MQWGKSVIEKYIVNTKKLIKNGLGHVFLASAFNQIISFASNFFLIRILTKNAFGTYSYAYNVYSFFALFAGFGVESACLQVCSENRENIQKAEEYMKFGLLFGSVFNIFLGFVIILSSKILSFSIAGTSELLLYFSILPILTTLFNCIQIYYRYNMQNQIYAENSLINTFLIMTGSISGAYILQAKGLILFRNFSFFVSIAVSVFAFHFPLKRIISREKISEIEKKDIIKIALISMLNIATGQLLYLIDVFLIGIVEEDSEIIAVYKTATILPNALLFIPNALMVYAYPYFASKQDDKRWVKNQFFTITKYFFMLNLVITTFLELTAPYVVTVLFGEQYLDAVPAFRILMVSYLFSASFRKIIGNLLVTQRKLRVNFWMGIAEGVLNIIFNWILIHKLGMVGAAITTLCICIFSSACLMVYFLNYLNKEIRAKI